MPTIDPQQIYPRRMGIYRGSLVVEYYNLERDCFKKHLIPYDSSDTTDKIIEGILKNPKHSVFLRKVALDHLKQAITGRMVNILPPDINEKSSHSSGPHESSSPYYTDFNSQSRNTSKQNSSSSYLNSSSNNTSKERDSSNNYSSQAQSSWQPKSSQNSQSNSDKWNAFKKKDVDESGSYNLSTSKLSKRSDKHKEESGNLDESHGYSMNFDEESMNISVVPLKQTKKNEHAIEEEINYEEDFEQLSAQKIEIQKEKQRLKEQQKKKQKQKEKEKEKQKQKKKSKQKKKAAEEIDQFQFLDDDAPKKKKKKKKDKEKEKQKSSKSNTISQNVSKEVSVREQVPIQEQFDFI